MSSSVTPSTSTMPRAQRKALEAAAAKAAREAELSAAREAHRLAVDAASQALFKTEIHGTVYVDSVPSSRSSSQVRSDSSSAKPDAKDTATSSDAAPTSYDRATKPVVDAKNADAQHIPLGVVTVAPPSAYLGEAPPKFPYSWIPAVFGGSSVTVACDQQANQTVTTVTIATKSREESPAPNVPSK